MNFSNRKNPQSNLLGTVPVLACKYDGGSHPGSKRVVYILDTDSCDNLKVWDFAIGEFRTFNPHLMRDIATVQDACFINTKSAPQSVVDACAASFVSSKYSVFHDQDDGTLVAVKLTNKCPHCGALL